MGQDRNEKRKLQPAKSIFNGPTSAGDGFDWGSVDPNRLRGIVALVSGRGGAIRFGYGRDGQAGSVGIYYGDGRDTLWIRPGEDYEIVFSRIAEYFEGHPFTSGRSPD